MNPNGFSVMLRDDAPIGMIELLPLKPRLLAPLIENDDHFHESSLDPEHIAAPNELDSPEGFTHIYFESVFIDPEERTQRLALDLAIDHATDLLLRVEADVNRGMIYAYPVAPPLPAVGAFPYSQRRYARTVSSVENFLLRHRFERQCRTRIPHAGKAGAYHDLMRASILIFLRSCADLTKASRRNRERTREFRRGEA